ncbi:MAG TPA: MFS transporter [Solirubrobacteraceae bacterium]|jgi:MFS family permease|nr:MFS transporter [Solirubrobacteraceae bacterium]
MTTETASLEHRSKRLPDRAAFGLLASILLILLASSSAPTPLYATYQARWGFSAITITVIFGVYAVAVLVSLLVFGSLSDHIGRRPVLVVALLTQTIVMLLFAFAGGLDVLLVARVIQGLATGAAVGAIGAGLVDLHPGRGPVANAVGAMSGTASGALGSALLVQLLPAPTKLVYLVLLVLFVIQAAGVLMIGETSPRREGARRSLRPTLALPGHIRGAVAIAAPSLIAVWALAGFYGSLGPSLAALVSGSHSTILGGASLFVLAGSGALAVLVFHWVVPRTFALVGNALMIGGVAVVLWSISARSVGLFFVGTAIAGAGFGGGFQGGLRTIVSLAEPTERAGVISVAYTICYLAMGLPAILAGFLVEHGTVTGTARQFGVAVMVLAATTAIGLTVGDRRARPVVLR